MALDAIDGVNQEVTVARVISTPSAARTGVSLHVDPNHSVKVAGDGCHHLIDLRRSGLASAGEHVDIGDESSCSGVVEVVVDIGINSTIRAIASDDGEGVAAVLHALVGGGGEELADVDTQNAQGGHYEEQGKQQIFHQQFIKNLLRSVVKGHDC